MFVHGDNEFYSNLSNLTYAIKKVSVMCVYAFITGLPLFTINKHFKVVSFKNVMRISLIIPTRKLNNSSK